MIVTSTLTDLLVHRHLVLSIPEQKETLSISRQCIRTHGLIQYAFKSLPYINTNESQLHQVCNYNKQSMSSTPQHKATKAKSVQNYYLSIKFFFTVNNLHCHRFRFHRFRFHRFRYHHFRFQSHSHSLAKERGHGAAVAPTEKGPSAGCCRVAVNDVCATANWSSAHMTSAKCVCYRNRWPLNNKYVCEIEHRPLFICRRKTF